MIIKRYQKAIAFCGRYVQLFRVPDAEILTAVSWEKGHYYLGKHYNKLLEWEMVKPAGKQAYTL